jgi:hypothetical protein
VDEGGDDQARVAPRVFKNLVFVPRTRPRPVPPHRDYWYRIAVPFGLAIALRSFAKFREAALANGHEMASEAVRKSSQSWRQVRVGFCGSDLRFARRD